MMKKDDNDNDDNDTSRTIHDPGRVYAHRKRMWTLNKTNAIK